MITFILLQIFKHTSGLINIYHHKFYINCKLRYWLLYKTVNHTSITATAEMIVNNTKPGCKQGIILNSFYDCCHHNCISHRYWFLLTSCNSLNNTMHIKKLVFHEPSSLFFNVGEIMSLLIINLVTIGPNELLLRDSYFCSWLDTAFFTELVLCVYKQIISLF